VIVHAQRRRPRGLGAVVLLSYDNRYLATLVTSLDGRHVGVDRLARLDPDPLPWLDRAIRSFAGALGTQVLPARLLALLLGHVFTPTSLA